MINPPNYLDRVIPAKEWYDSERESRTYPPSILIIGSNSPQTLKLAQQLKNNGCRVRRIDSSCDDLAAVRQQYFDLIVLDLELIERPDSEMYQKLKTDPELASIPLIILMTRAQLEAALTELEISPLVYYLAKDALTESRLLQLIGQIHYMIYRYM